MDRLSLALFPTIKILELKGLVALAAIGFSSRKAARQSQAFQSVEYIEMDILGILWHLAEGKPVQVKGLYHFNQDSRIRRLD
ncbi:hypothetical protein [Leptolyngbya sp. FACHB-261]|uniref:hypothetical protein n=1 Tax=Leptolyngbya sp. FACHB-261 TaxID=2692806 RepID=UPI0016858094|nr:hypothetical protein [Leptolyngbya sp. FACHB-261]MBD2100337.1 hypothetical protein [Leptolyngbya sp. FACHB-261]